MDSDDYRFKTLVPQKYHQFLRPKAGTNPVQPNMVHLGRAWHKQGPSTRSIWYNGGPMLIEVRVRGPQTIYKDKMYGVWIGACPAQPGDSMVLDNRARARCGSKPPSPQSSDYDLHGATYQLISTKALQVRRAHGHLDPKKAHTLKGLSRQDWQRIGRLRSPSMRYYAPLSRSG